jgi:GABA(A) receptor-associated protein
MQFNFKSQHSIQERCEEALRIMQKYPQRIPIICERSTSTTSDCPIIDKNKYLVNNELTIGQFIYVIRKRMQISSDKALFIFINGYIPPSSQCIGDIYCFHKDQDGFLYITYSFENTFG